jgi:hypothetical protein
MVEMRVSSFSRKVIACIMGGGGGDANLRALKKQLFTRVGRASCAAEVSALVAV